MVEVEVMEVEVEAAEVDERTDQERAIADIHPWVFAYRRTREEIKRLEAFKDECKVPILAYVKEFGNFILDGKKGMMKTRRGTISYDREALDTLCAAWADGNKTEQKYARLISAYRTVKSDTTYLEVK